MTDIYTTGDAEIDRLVHSFRTNQENKEISKDYFVTFEQVFVKVWERIINPEKFESLWIDGVKPDKIEMMRRFKQEMQEASGMCFTGRLSRLVNTLMGFYSDIHIGVGGSDQINARISIVLEQFANLSIEEQKEKIRESLREIDVSPERIEEWISNIWLPEEVATE